MKIISESEMSFGKFDESDLFHIEDSNLYQTLGSGVKTVEFILKYKEDSIVFLEAKKSCPNSANRKKSEEKAEKFEEYYASITGKICSLSADLSGSYFESLSGYFGSWNESAEDIRYEENKVEIHSGC